jgi:hypothetical protein
MQVRAVRSGIVSASNGGCNAFDINRSLAAGVADLNPLFSKAPLSTLALGIIATQPSKNPFASNLDWMGFAMIKE